MKTHSDFEAKYPPETEPYRGQLKQFRAEHEPRQLELGASRWQYLTGGQGDEVVLALHGGGGPAESIFRYIQAFEESYRVVAPTVPETVSTVAEILQAIEAILSRESVGSVHLFGVSNGGMIGQCLLRRRSELVRNLVLFHSMLPSQDYAKQFGKRAKGMALLPHSLIISQGLKFLQTQIELEADNAKPGEQAFWIAYFTELYHSDLMTKRFFVSRAKILTDYFGNYDFAHGEVPGWQGRVMIIESENDQIVTAKERERLKTLYSDAQVHTFTGAGHFGGGLFKVEETAAMVKDFFAAR